MGVSRLPDGVVNKVRGDFWGDFEQPVPLSGHYYFDDFNYYRSQDYDIVGSPTVTLPDSGESIVSIVASFGSTGVLEKKGQSFAFEDPKQMWMEFVIEASQVGVGAYSIGLINLDATPDEGVYFNFTSSGQLFLFIVENGVEAIHDTGVTIVNGEDYRIGLHHDEAGTFNAFVNDAKVLEVEGSGDPQADMTPAIAVTPTVADLTLLMDYWFFGVSAR